MQKRIFRMPGGARAMMVLLAILCLSTLTVAQEDALENAQDVIILEPADKVEDVFDVDDDDFDDDFDDDDDDKDNEQIYLYKPSVDQSSACRQSMLASPGTGSNPVVISMSELEKNPESYYGQTVTIDGEMHRIFTDNVFTIEDSGFFRDHDVLIISTAPMSDVVTPVYKSIEPGKNVRVTGVVHPYDRGKLECAYGPLNLELREGHSFTKNPVLVIDRREAAVLAPPVIREKPAPMPEAAPPEPPPFVLPALPAPEPLPPLPPEPLPKTAGELPLLALAGLGALCLGYMLRNNSGSKRIE